jgi:Uma2 family endonuclease
MAIQLPRYRFCVDDYHRMAEAGILNEDSAVELIEGEIVQMSPIGAPHLWCVATLTQLLAPAVMGDAIVSVQNPIRIDEHSEPEPDIALVLPSAAAHRDRPPSPEDVLLVIEVADSSLRYDREVKVPLYSRAGIPEVWLIDLTSNTVFRYVEPRTGTYRRVELYQQGDVLSPSALPSETISVGDLFG